MEAFEWSRLESRGCMSDWWLWTMINSPCEALASEMRLVYAQTLGNVL